MKEVVIEKRYVLLICNFIFFSLFFCHCNPRPPKGTFCQYEPCWENLIDSHLKRYPDLQIEDLYKLVYQATLGNSHAISDSAEVRDWLKRDMADPSQNVNEPMIDTLGSCGRFARIHLYAYRLSGRQPEKIIQTFINTSVRFPADSDAFFCAVEVVRKMSAEGKLPWKDSITIQFLSEQAVKKYPAIHHSEKFISKYHPHYRIIAVELIPDLLDTSSERISDQSSDSMVSFNLESGTECYGSSTQNSDC
jgi:hypothetical protein